MRDRSLGPPLKHVSKLDTSSRAPHLFFVWSLFQRFKNDAGVILVIKRSRMAAFLLNAPDKKDTPNEKLLYIFLYSYSLLTGAIFPRM